MRIKFESCFAACIIALTVSCDMQPPQDPNDNYANYSNLAVGNYWVYDKYSIDSLGNEMALGSFDTVRIESDTLINGNTYFKMVEPAFTINSPYFLSIPEKTTFLRDSLHYTVTSDHTTIFSSEDFSTVFSSDYSVGVDTQYLETTQMAEQNVTITVPAGTFTTSTFKRLILADPDYYWAFGDSVVFRTRYAENIGIITKHLPLPWAQFTRIERRLVDYYVQ